LLLFRHGRRYLDRINYLFLSFDLILPRQAVVDGTLLDNGEQNRHLIDREILVLINITQAGEVFCGKVDAMLSIRIASPLAC